jgi:hypothetical protein
LWTRADRMVTDAAPWIALGSDTAYQFTSARGGQLPADLLRPDLFPALDNIAPSSNVATRRGSGLPKSPAGRRTIANFRHQSWSLTALV